MTYLPKLWPFSRNGTWRPCLLLTQMARYMWRRWGSPGMMSLRSLGSSRSLMRRRCVLSTQTQVQPQPWPK